MKPHSAFEVRVEITEVILWVHKDNHGRNSLEISMFKHVLLQIGLEHALDVPLAGHPYV